MPCVCMCACVSNGRVHFLGPQPADQFGVHVGREGGHWAKMSVVWINGEVRSWGAAVEREQNICSRERETEESNRDGERERERERERETGGLETATNR